MSLKNEPACGEKRDKRCGRVNGGRDRDGVEKSAVKDRARLYIKGSEVYTCDSRQNVLFDVSVSKMEIRF